MPAFARLYSLTLNLLAASAVLTFAGSAVAQAAAAKPAAASPAPAVAAALTGPLGVTWSVLQTQGSSGFYLRRFNGKVMVEEPLQLISGDGTSLKVGTPGQAVFTFRLDENLDYLALHLVKAEGDFSARDLGLMFRSNPATPVEAIRLNYMVQVSNQKGQATLSWPYLWNTNPTDPLGSFAFIRTGGTPEARDRSLAAIWAEGTLPHPKIAEAWTPQRALAWVDAYQRKFAGLSETTLSATTPAELYQLTDWLHSTGVNRVYLHTNTWREEYWPVTRSFVAVNPAIFPGGRADLLAYRDYLNKKGMQLRLHSVSAGIGRQDPEFVLGGRIEPRLATWVKGRLETATDSTAKELVFRPDPGADFPHLRINQNYWNLTYFRVGGEVVRTTGVADVDGPVWRLQGAQRGFDNTAAAAHAAGTEVAGLFSAYGQNYVPDNQSDLLAEMASRYARLVNEASLDHQHYDGAEIHNTGEPWGFDKLTYLVAGQLDHPVSSSTSGGTMSPWAFEAQFSQISGMTELAYFPACIPTLLAGHRNANDWLDAHYAVAAMLLKSSTRLGFNKPEPMFGMTTEAVAGHGLMTRFEQLFKQWQGQIGNMDADQIAYLRTLLSPVQSKLGQSGQHSQGNDVPVLEARADGDYLVPTRVLLRDGLDGPWIFGQEFGPIGPRQYLQPGETVTLTNPHPAQPPSLILQVLPALGEGGAQPKAGQSGVKAAGTDAGLDNYRTGTEHVNQPGTEAATATPVASTGSSLMPAKVAEVGQVTTLGGKYDTALTIEAGGLTLKAENKLTTPVWEERLLPAWKVKVPLQGRRAVALDLVGDGSGAVLLLQLDSHGVRDYVVKIDFTGPRRVIIPNGEASWSLACWGWRFDAKHIDYDGTLSRVRLGFGFIPGTSHPQVKVTGLHVLDNVPGTLRDPAVRLGTGRLQVKGELQPGEYLTYSEADGAQVFDRNWVFLRKLPSKAEAWVAPCGLVPVRIETASTGALPGCALQVITRGEPHKLPPAQPRR